MLRSILTRSSFGSRRLVGVRELAEEVRAAQANLVSVGECLRTGILHGAELEARNAKHKIDRLVRTLGSRERD